MWLVPRCWHSIQPQLWHGRNHHDRLTDRVCRQSSACWHRYHLAIWCEYPVENPAIIECGLLCWQEYHALIKGYFPSLPYFRLKCHNEKMMKRSVSDAGYLMYVTFGYIVCLLTKNTLTLHLCYIILGQLWESRLESWLFLAWVQPWYRACRSGGLQRQLPGRQHTAQRGGIALCSNGGDFRTGCH